MAWQVPSAAQLSERMAGFLETALTKVADLRNMALDPAKLSLAVRSPWGVFAQVIRTVALELRSVHDHIAYRGRQLFVDQCDDDNVPLHASMWGVARREPVKAIGSVTLTGTVGAAIPAGILLSSSAGVAYQTTVGGDIPIGGSLTLGAQAIDGGLEGNLPSGVRLTIQTVTPDLVSAVVASAFSGGADQQDAASWRDDVRSRIRRPPHGGADFDYKTWVADIADVAAVKVVPGWIGNGSVGLIIAMNDPAGPRVPTVGELTAIGTYIASVKPVTANVIPVPAAIVSVPLTVQVRPDTAAVRAAIIDAWQRFIATLGDEDDTVNTSPIGATIERSRIIEALSAATGEYAHDLIAPAATYALGSTQYPVAGPVTFV